MRPISKEVAAILAMVGMSPEGKARAEYESNGVPVSLYFRRSIKQRWKQWRKLGR